MKVIVYKKIGVVRLSNIHSVIDNEETIGFGQKKGNPLFINKKSIRKLVIKNEEAK